MIEPVREVAPTDSKATTTQKRPPEDANESPAAPDAAKWRPWITADGKYKLEAKFVKFLDGKVTLEKKDGTTVGVKLDILSQQDQDFVTGRSRER